MGNNCNRMAGSHRLLQLRHMEDGVHQGRCWQLEVISNRPHASGNMVWPEKLGCQLLIGTLSKRGLNIQLNLDIHHVAHLKLPFRTIVISKLLNTLLCSVQVHSDDISHELTVRQPG
jgi:hypothetical protein